LFYVNITICVPVLTLIICDNCMVQSGYYCVVCDMDHSFPVECQTLMCIECRIYRKAHVNIL